ncbi:MAG: GPW/gp25 family protein [Desulfovibrionaceae bacterium]
MRGMDAATGRELSGVEHLRQSVSDILNTRINTRVQRREYGSRLPEMIDRPMNGDTLVEVFAATAEALATWEPRFKLRQVRVASAEPGRLVLDLDGEYLPDGQSITLEGIVII